MKYQIITILSVLVLFTSVNIFGQKAINTAADSFFKQHVKNGQVNYKGIKDNPEALNNLVEQIGNYKSQGKESDFSFYLNAYNVLVIKQVVENYPLDSPLSIDGFFDKKTFLVAGEKITLNHIENEIIRPTYNDARIHFALVCGAVDCPKLTNGAFTSENLESKLQSNTINALNDKNFVKYKDGILAISKIFEWYKADFGGDEAAFLNFINQYRKEPIPDGTKIGFYEYDWSLNKQ